MNTEADQIAEGETFTPADENAAAEAPAAEKPAREKQNGVTRPAPGTKTGAVWDAADAVSAELGRPALIGEVRERLEGVNKGTLSTQYAKWSTFNGVTAEMRKAARADVKAAEDAAAAEAKAEAEAEQAEAVEE